MISPRFLLPTLGLVALAAIPTTLHSYLDSTASDGRLTSDIDTTLVGWSSRPVELRDRWVRNVYGSADWFERRYRVSGRRDVQLFVARSFDAKKLYHHPELGVAYRGDYTGDFRGDGVTELTAGDGLIPVHVLRGAQGQGLALYALHAGGGFVANPYVYQLQSALALLVAPREPMTLFFAHDRNETADAPIDDTEAAALLRAAVESFLDS